MHDEVMEYMSTTLWDHLVDHVVPSARSCAGSIAPVDTAIRDAVSDAIVAAGDRVDKDAPNIPRRPPASVG